ncbi:MAG: T9SS type A sorting domain-containing protein [Candidatus Kapaibacterium sp.]
MKNLFTTFLILCTSLVSAQWSQQNSNVTTELTSVYAVDKNTAWVCGFGSTILRTKNQGTNWQKVDGNGLNGIPLNVSLESIAGIDSSTAIVPGVQSTNTWVWKTSNGGANWIEVFHQSNGFVNGVCMLNQTTGILVGDPAGGRWTLFKTTNAGSTWDSAGMYLASGGASEGGYNNSFFSVSPYVWFGTNNSRIYYSTNSGVNWSVQSISPEVNSYSIWVSQELYGLSGGAANLMETSNNGLNWASMSAAGTGNICGITTLNIPVDFPSVFMWYVRIGSSSIYSSFNGGANWMTEYTNPTGTYRHMSNAVLGWGIWAVGTNGSISFHQPITNITPIGSVTPEKYSLSQNYPNPFNPSTVVRFSLPVVSQVSLKVYDMMGREVETLVNERLQVGTYETVWNASTYSSGVYLYKLTAGNYTETKRMTLVK